MVYKLNVAGLQRDLPLQRCARGTYLWYNNINRTRGRLFRDSVAAGLSRKDMRSAGSPRGEDSDLTDRQAAVRIAELAAEKGGRAYYVGGLVRDALLAVFNKEEYPEKEISPKDVDIEVHGIAPQDLFELLKEVGEPLQYGSSFGVYGLKGLGIDIAMPRKETAVGRGHKDFEIDVDPFLGYE